jgi:BirA family biotin operon repressor/biotin-[acetyl-CoA-carboxylase] ligase
VKDPKVWHLDTKHIGRRVLVYDRVDSTNSLALELARDRANDGVAILAKEQTAGRGRYGRNWHCPPGAGVLLSVALFAPDHVRRPVLLTAWAAVAVADAVHHVSGLEARIKWPNDVLVDGNKVAGILVERGMATVVGIGLNVNQTAEDLRSMGLLGAGSLSLCCSRRFDVSRVARTVIRRLDGLYDQIQNGELNDLKARWKRFLAISGREVVVACQDSVIRGRVRELDWETLELDVPGEGPVRVRPENIKGLNVIEAGDGES